MKKLLLILLCLPMIGFGQTLIPDANFEQALINLGYDTSPINGSVPTANIDAVNSLNINNQSITDLTGIEDFTALTYLDCGGNQLTSLDVSQNTALADLYCDSNQLTSLNVSNNTALYYLRCDSNQITSLDVSNNTVLTVLHCYNNQLTNLDVSNNTALINLRCDGNQLTSLDVSNNTALYNLICYYNQLTSLDVSNNTALTYLHCAGNQLTSLDVSINTALTLLSLWSNQLTSLDVSNNTALTYLNCGTNQFTSLDVTQNTGLITFFCWSNQLANLDLTQNIDLTYLRCWNNQLTSLDVSNNTALAYLNCNSNQLTSLDVSQNTALADLYCGGNQLTSLDVRNGNNIFLNTNFYSKPNPNLYCIDVDDVAWADSNWTVANGNIDSTMSFSSNCVSALGCTDSLACNYDALATIDDSSCIYGISSSSYDTLSVTTSIVWNSNTLNVSGDYSDTLINSAGCDSIAYLNLTITNTTGLLDVTNTEKTLLKITDMLGQETPQRRNTPLFYIYDDGTVEKRIVIE
jgi:Leucine-rich repeat (LRR) protein